MKIIDLLERIDAGPGAYTTKHEDADALIHLGLATESRPGTVTNSGPGFCFDCRCLKLTPDGRDLLHGASERRLSA